MDSEAVAPIIDSVTRYRCSTCGNLTRFDVTSRRRTRAYHHYSVGGDLNVENEEVLDETIESVECRWCGAAGNVETFSDKASDQAQATEQKA